MFSGTLRTTRLWSGHDSSAIWAWHWKDMFSRCRPSATHLVLLPKKLHRLVPRRRSFWQQQWICCTRPEALSLAVPGLLLLPSASYFVRQSCILLLILFLASCRSSTAPPASLIHSVSQKAAGEMLVAAQKALG